jgi:acyl-CoA thioesterase I
MKDFLLIFGTALASAAVCAAEPPRTILCFGDSITAGSELPASERASAWPALVEKQSGGKLRVINEGKGGRPTASLGEFRAVLAKHAGAARVDVLVVSLGTNDSRDTSEAGVTKAVANVRQMIALARARDPRLGVLLVGPPNLRKDTLGPTKPIADQRQRQLRELNAAFALLARDTGCEFVSLFGVVPAASLARDGVHPDAAGNEAIARVISEALAKALGK